MKRHCTEEDLQMAKQHLKRCSMSLATREMQVTTTARDGHPYVSMAKTKNSEPGAGEDGEKLALLHIVSMAVS